jgi:hypothetical protein
MIIIYDPDSLRISQIVTVYPEGYENSLAATHLRLTDPPQELPKPEEIKLVRTLDGEVVVERLRRMTIHGPGTGVVDTSVVFFGIPEGTHVMINGASQGVMDAGGSLELRPRVAGTYHMVLNHPDYIIMEKSFEAVPGN